jgi:hypothetical protein
MGRYTSSLKDIRSRIRPIIVARDAGRIICPTRICAPGAVLTSFTCPSIKSRRPRSSGAAYIHVSCPDLSEQDERWAGAAGWQRSCFACGSPRDRLPSGARSSVMQRALSLLPIGLDERDESLSVKSSMRHLFEP